MLLPFSASFSFSRSAGRGCSRRLATKCCSKLPGMVALAGTANAAAAAAAAATAAAADAASAKPLGVTVQAPSAQLAAAQAKPQARQIVSAAVESRAISEAATGFRSGDAQGQKAAVRKLGQLTACRVCWQGGWPCQDAAAQVTAGALLLPPRC